MSTRIKKINKHIQRILAEILQINVDLPTDALVTVSHVDTAPNLKNATVWLYVMPLERGEEILEQINSEIYFIQGEFNNQVHLSYLPRLKFELDHGASHADRIARQLSELE